MRPQNGGARMKRSAPVILAVWGVLSAGIIGADLWSDLHVPETEARTLTIQSILNGSIPTAGASVFKRATPAARAVMVQQFATWAKAFTTSAAFKTAYDAARANEKPAPPKPGGSASAQLTQQRDEFDKNAAEMRKNAAGQSKEVRDAIETAIRQMKVSLDAMAKDSSMLQAMDKASAQSNADEQARYKERLATFEREHPASVDAAVALRLHQFLDTCKDVDFSAPLVSTKGSMKFVNPVFEAKSSEWKMCYRAGREPVEAARVLATAWLKDIVVPAP